MVFLSLISPIACLLISIEHYILTSLSFPGRVPMFNYWLCEQLLPFIMINDILRLLLRCVEVSDQIWYGFFRKTFLYVSFLTQIKKKKWKITQGCVMHFLFLTNLETVVWILQKKESFKFSNHYCQFIRSPRLSTFDWVTIKKKLN